jgi:hypothetical protein
VQEILDKKQESFILSEKKKENPRNINSILELRTPQEEKVILLTIDIYQAFQGLKERVVARGFQLSDDMIKRFILSRDLDVNGTEPIVVAYMSWKEENHYD